jgi:uncharacterized protein YjbI with pentapeptide repeats
MIIKDLTGRTILLTPWPHLERQDFRGQSFVGADLRGLHMAGGIFDAADFTGADFTGADLSNASLRDCTFDGAVLDGACVRGADFTNAGLIYARWDGARDLDDARGLDLTGLVIARYEERMRGRIQSFRERRRYAAHLRSALSDGESHA